MDYAMELGMLVETNDKFGDIVSHEEAAASIDFGTCGDYWAYMGPTSFLPWSVVSYLWERFVRKSKLLENLKSFDKEMDPEKHAEPFISACNAVPKADLEKYLCKSIDETSIKCFWERHFNKISIEKAVNSFSLELGEEYAEKLSHLDDYHKGEDLGFPYGKSGAERGGFWKNCDEDLVARLFSYFIDEDTARRFLRSIQGQKDAEITNLVNHYWEMGAIRKGTKKTHLWRTLHYADLYKAQESNWNAMVDFKKK